MFFLLFGQLADITTPFYIGKVVDLIREEEFEEIKTWCGYQAIVVVVSITATIILTLSRLLESL